MDIFDPRINLEPYLTNLYGKAEEENDIVMIGKLNKDVLKDFMERFIYHNMPGKKTFDRYRRAYSVLQNLRTRSHHFIITPIVKIEKPKIKDLKELESKIGFICYTNHFIPAYHGFDVDFISD